MPAAATALVLVWALPVLADPESKPVRDGAPPVSLDSLLKLPPGTSARPEPQAGGASRSEWMERFRAAQADLTQAERRLAEAQAKLETLAGSSESWQVTAPGAPAGTESGPLSYGLRQEIRRQREEMERARRELDDLRVEANLAGVPPEWFEEAQRDADPTGAETAATPAP